MVTHFWTDVSPAGCQDWLPAECDFVCLSHMGLADELVYPCGAHILAESEVRFWNSCTSAYAGSSKSSSVSARSGAGRDWHSQSAVFDAFTGSKHMHSAMGSLVITGTANALHSEYLRLTFRHLQTFP